MVSGYDRAPDRYVAIEISGAVIKAIRWSTLCVRGLRDRREGSRMAREVSAGSSQDLCFALGWPEDESGSVIRDFIHAVANGGLHQYKTIFQTGAKHGEPLYNHVLNMIFVAERLQLLLALSDVETRVLYSAVPVHDLNKVGDRSGVSFNRLATVEAVKEELNRST
jgi:hypothetical protein